MECSNEIELGQFLNGSLDVNVNSLRIACLRIVSQYSHQNWVIFREIQIDSDDDNVPVINPESAMQPSLPNTELHFKKIIKKQEKLT